MMKKSINSDELLTSDQDYRKIEQIIDNMQSTAPIGESRTYGMTGWICPVCGRGLSPFTSVCPCRGYTRIDITC